MPNGELIDLGIADHHDGVAAAFDSAAVRNAISEAQRLIPGYTYQGFCRKVMAAGFAGYMVSIPGRRAVYYGRTGEIHTEIFPDQN